jgi:hypothetical protein
LNVDVPRQLCLLACVHHSHHNMHLLCASRHDVRAYMPHVPSWPNMRSKSEHTGMHAAMCACMNLEQGTVYVHLANYAVHVYPRAWVYVHLANYAVVRKLEPMNVFGVCVQARGRDQHHACGEESLNKVLRLMLTMYTHLHKHTVYARKTYRITTLVCACVSVRTRARIHTHTNTRLRDDSSQKHIESQLREFVRFYIDMRICMYPFAFLQGISTRLNE